MTTDQIRVLLRTAEEEIRGQQDHHPEIVYAVADIAGLHKNAPDLVAAQKVAIAGLFLIVCDCAARDGDLQHLLAEAERLRDIVHYNAPRRVVPNVILPTAKEIPRA